MTNNEIDNKVAEYIKRVDNVVTKPRLLTLDQAIEIAKMIQSEEHFQAHMQGNEKIKEFMNNSNEYIKTVQKNLEDHDPYTDLLNDPDAQVDPSSIVDIRKDLSSRSQN